MKALLGDDYNTYLRCLDQPMFHGLRINTSKISVEDFLKINPFSLTPVPWCPNGFYYDEKVDKPSRHPYYYAGLYYLQEPSAMTPAAVLPVEPGDRVLDVCAAPGGKSTELGAKLSGEGLLVSNDVSASRAKALLKNIEVFGIRNPLVLSELPFRLQDRFSGYFNKILIDAPCSGEGMFRKSYSMVTAWEHNGNELFANLQKEIIDGVLPLLAPGGMLLYSTCTFSPMENERSIEYLLSKDESIHVIPFDKAEGFADGRPELSASGNPDLAYAARLFPHKINGEGHFVCLLKKDGDSTGSFAEPFVTSQAGISSEASEFLSQIKPAFDQKRLHVSGDKISLIPKDFPAIGGLRVMRAGLFVGEMKKKRFEPSQSLAMALTKDAFSNVLDLAADDERVIRYLKGETIDDDSVKDGTVLITVSGYPLGWGKAGRGSIKNKYLPGWRMMG